MEDRAEQAVRRPHSPPEARVRADRVDLEAADPAVARDVLEAVAEVVVAAETLSPPAPTSSS